MEREFTKSENFMLKLYDRADKLHNNKSGIDTLIGVLLKELILFIQTNFMEKNSFNLPKFSSPFFIFRALKFIWKTYKIIKTYRENKDLFKEKYSDNVLNFFEFTNKIYSNN